MQSQVKKAIETSAFAHTDATVELQLLLSVHIVEILGDLLNKAVTPQPNLQHHPNPNFNTSSQLDRKSISKEKN